MTSPGAHPTPSLIMFSFTTAAAAMFLSASIRQGGCSSISLDGAGRRNASTYQRAPQISGHLSTSSEEEKSRDALSWMRLRRAADDVEKFPCYTCMYHKVNDFTTGSADCGEPFSSSDIPEVMCSTSCNKMTQKSQDGGFLIGRGCMPNCAERVDRTGYNLCCSTKYCNHSTSLNSVSHVTVASVVSLALLTYFLTNRMSPLC